MVLGLIDLHAPDLEMPSIAQAHLNRSFAYRRANPDRKHREATSNSMAMVRGISDPDLL